MLIKKSLFILTGSLLSLDLCCLIALAYFSPSDIRGGVLKCGFRDSLGVNQAESSSKTRGQAGGCRLELRSIG